MTDTFVPVITIDGPSGTGKGTICRHLAHWLGWNLLDSGALYRALAIATEKHAVGLDNEAFIARLAEDMAVEFNGLNGDSGMRVFLEGDDVTQQIMSEKCGSIASKIAVLPTVRHALLERQRRFLQPPGLIADGRDMGTIVFAFAKLKIYLTATVEERAKRRYKQLKDKNVNVTLIEVAEYIEERDIRDSQRVLSPMKPANDAVIIDTTEIGITTLQEKVEVLIRSVLSDICIIP